MQWSLLRVPEERTDVEKRPPPQGWDSGHSGEGVPIDHWIAENFAGVPVSELDHRYWARRKHPSKMQVGQGWETDFQDTCVTYWKAVNRDGTAT